MALESVMRVNKGKVIGGGSGGGETYMEIAYEDWLELTPQQQETGKWDVTGVPGADGTVSIDLMTKLWENPSPAASFAGQDVNISIAGYDFVMILALWSNAYTQAQAFFGRVGAESILLYFSLAGTANGSYLMHRSANISVLSKITFADAKEAIGTAAASINNDRCVPIAIYGIKTTASVKVSAIAENVKASVEYSTSEHLIGKWIDGSDLYEKTIDFGALPNATSKSVAHGITGLATMVNLYGFAKNPTNNAQITLPYVDTTAGGNIALLVNANNIIITDANNMSIYTQTYITLRYTKNS